MHIGARDWRAKEVATLNRELHSLAGGGELRRARDLNLEFRFLVFLHFEISGETVVAGFCLEGPTTQGCIFGDIHFAVESAARRERYSRSKALPLFGSSTVTK